MSAYRAHLAAQRMGEESATESRHRHDDDHRPTMIDSNQQSATDDKIKAQHSELSMAQRDSDNSKQTGDKKNENGHNLNGNDSKRPKTVCYDFKKGFCRRRFCRVSALGNAGRITGFNSILFQYFAVSACVER